MNVVEIEEAVSELARTPFSQDGFIAAFMLAYGAARSTIARLTTDDGGPSNATGSVIWRKWLHFRPSQTGGVSQTLDELESSKTTTQAKVRYVLTTDGDEFAARDLKAGESLFCDHSALGDHFGFFLPIAGIDRYEVADENPVDIKATGRLARFYDALVADNPDWKSDARRHELNQFMTRIIFCLFAEDTGIFPNQLFSKTIKERAGSDHRLAAPTLEAIFEVMNLNDKDSSRAGKAGWACAFPYVNGGLFAGTHHSPTFGRAALRYLLEACKLDWKLINPDIFGSMIQGIANEAERGELGMHYTSVPNILKVLNPLFLDKFRHQIEEGWNSKAALQNVLRQLMKVAVFDPACGSGNFLVVAYRELRKLEIQILKRIQVLTGTPPGVWSHVNLKNFFGIEIADFAAETAKLSLWISEFQMNAIYEDEIGKLSPALPLTGGASIRCGNALQIEWSTICEPSSDSHATTYIVGNPPYYGRQKRNEQHQGDMENVFSSHTGKYANLDYVAAWVFKAAKYIQVSNSPNIKSAFVVTNSICQGEQVSLLWSLVFDMGVELGFAYTSFKWSNLASNNAGVTCAIVGLQPSQKGKKHIYGDLTVREVDGIGPYLTSGQQTIVWPRSSPISHLTPMDYGSMANDGGNLLLSSDERASLESSFPESKKLVKRIFGGQEFIRNVIRYCLWIEDSSLPLAQSIPPISKRIELTKRAREESKRAATAKEAGTPYKFAEIRHKSSMKILIPNL